MLNFQFLLCKGAGGRAACQCKTLDGHYTVLQFRLGDLPLPCIAVAGNGILCYHTVLSDSIAQWQIPPIRTDDLWVALCRPSGEVLCWGCVGGEWQTDMGLALCALFAPKQETPSLDEKHSSPQEEVGATHDVPIEECEKQPQRDAEQGDERSQDAAVAEFHAQQATVEVSNEQESGQANDVEGETQSSGEEKPTDADGIATQDEDLAQIEGERTPKKPLVAAIPDAYREYFEHYPSCPELEARIRPSRFVTVRQEDFSYVLGVLYDSDGNPTHLCYGVAGTQERPLSDGEWLPLDGETGYWLIYQALE